MHHHIIIIIILFYIIILYIIMVAKNKKKSFKQLSQDERIEIYKYLCLWYSFRKIWLLLNRSHSTISREVNRNSTYYWWWKTKYKPIEANYKAVYRRKKSYINRIKLNKNIKLRKKIFELLSDKTKYRSPDEIIWRLKLEWWSVVSTSTLYNYIHNHPDWSMYLRFKHYWYKKRNTKKSTTTIKWVPKIDKRSNLANNRCRLWDWEIDTIVSSSSYWWLFTWVDRKSRFILLRKIPNHKSNTLLTIMSHSFINHKVKTITSDNWVEFAKLALLWKRLKAKCYTTHPYSSFERWTNERHNWLVRRFIPKWSNISTYSDLEIKNKTY